MISMLKQTMQLKPGYETNLLGLIFELDGKFGTLNCSALPLIGKSFETFKEIVLNCQ